MKEILFGEEQLGNLGEIGAELFEDENDPRSTAYVRTLNRPKISLFKTLLCYVCLPAVAVTALILALHYCGISDAVTAVAASATLLAYFLIAAKRILICAIQLYQKYAPDSLRNKCRFEPSCSEYMRLAIEKYGLAKGLRKGIDRLKRCNTDGGGYDFP